MKTKEYRWLDVKTVSEGWREVTPWMVFGVVMLAHALYMLSYEMVYLNVEDRDNRDMLFDRRITNNGIQSHHQHFRTASWRYLEETSDWDTASYDLPVIVYTYNPGRCRIPMEVPCLSTDHRERDESVGPLNAGTDIGQWAVSATQSLVRNSTFQGIVPEIKFRFDNVTVLIEELESNLDEISFMVSEVPPPSSTGLDAEFSAEWSLEDWEVYATAVWDQLLQVKCNRNFDLCEQTAALREEVAYGDLGTLRLVIYEDTDLDWSAPIIKTFRDGRQRSVGGVYEILIGERSIGYVSTSELLQYAETVRAEYPSDRDYVVPEPRTPLTMALQVNNQTVDLYLRTESNGELSKFSSFPLWMWPSPCPDTATERFLLTGTATDLNRPAWTNGGAFAMLTVGALRDERDVAWYQMHIDYDEGTIEVDILTGLEVEVSFSTLRSPCCMWELHSVMGVYTPHWSGQINEAGDQFPETSVSIDVVMRDVSEPIPPYLPKFTGSWRVVTALAAAGWFAIMLLTLPCLGVVIYFHMMDNNDLPPLFYRDQLKYRGW